MSRSIHCECHERYTCGHCLRNAKPTPRLTQIWEEHRARELREKILRKRLTRS